MLAAKKRKKENVIRDDDQCMLNAWSSQSRANSSRHPRPDYMASCLPDQSGYRCLFALSGWRRPIRNKISTQRRSRVLLIKKSAKELLQHSLNFVHVNKTVRRQTS
jgi:hypothetical protein